MKLSDIEKEIETELISIMSILHSKNGVGSFNVDDLKNMTLKDLSKKLRRDASQIMRDLELRQVSEDGEIPTKNELEYEKLLVKLENDIRSHIKIEFQLKIYIESLESKVEGLEKQIESTLKENSKLKEEIATSTLKHKISELEEVTVLYKILLEA